MLPAGHALQQETVRPTCNLQKRRDWRLQIGHDLGVDRAEIALLAQIANLIKGRNKLHWDLREYRKLEARSQEPQYPIQQAVCKNIAPPDSWLLTPADSRKFGQHRLNSRLHIGRQISRAPLGQQIRATD